MANKVLNEAEYRQMNEAFDCLIDEANANYEREEGVFSELDFE
jgi:hypothetical protein